MVARPKRSGAATGDFSEIMTTLEKFKRATAPLQEFLPGDSV